MERNKFEEMLERLVNEDTQGAKDLFHEIVVEKSRNIYESLLENDMYADEEVDEAADMDDEDFDLEEDFDIEEDFDLEEGDDDMEGPEMDMDMGDDEGGMEVDMDDLAPGQARAEEMDGELEDRVDDIEGMLDSLKAEMDELFAEKEGEDDDKKEFEDDMGGDMDMEDDMGGDETDDLEADVEADDEDEDDVEESFDFNEAEEEDEDEDDEPKNESEMMASYLKKLDEYTQPVTAENDKPGKGNNGDGKSSVAGNGKSPELKSGNGAGNLNQGATADTKGTGGKVKGDLKSGNVNVPGGNGASKLNKVAKGHGAEKKSGKAQGEGTAKQFLKPAK